MRVAIAFFTLAGLWIVGASAASVEDVVLLLPHPLRSGEQLTVAISVGPIGRRRIEVTTAQDQLLGTISLFGVPTGRAGGTYLIPVPPDAVRDGKLELHFTITSGAERRSPTAEEVTGVHLSLPRN